MLSLGLNLLGFINGWHTIIAVLIAASAGAYAEAAGMFAVRIGLSAAAFALVGRGNLGQAIGVFIGAAMMT